MDAIVAAADYQHVDQDLLPPTVANYNEKYWNTRVMAPSSLLFYLGIDRKVEGLLHHNLFFDEDFEAHAHEIYTSHQWPQKPLFYICAPSVTDPTVAPEGMENVFVLIPTSTQLTGDDEPTRNFYLQMVMDRLKAVKGIDFSSNIMYQRSYGISDFKSDYHAFKGNAYGLANTLSQTDLLKPAMRSKKLNNLYFAGQLTLPGPGMPPSIISGRMAAHSIIKNL